MSEALDLHDKVWLRKESDRLTSEGEPPGSPLEKFWIARWRQNHPKLMQEYDRQGQTERLAHVLVCKAIEAENEYLEAGMPLTDAQEQAERDWLDLEPEA